MKRIGILICLLLPGCAHKMVKVTGRYPGAVKEQEGLKAASSRPVGPSRRAPEIYVKKKNLRIKEKVRQPVGGSLYLMDDPRNRLFVDVHRGMPGTWLNVAIVSNRLNPKKSDQKVDGEGKAKQGQDDLEKTLIAALPNLDGAESNPVILKTMKMRVTHKLENGDVMAIFQRDSTNGMESNSISVSARIPYHALMADRPLTTADLEYVDYAESKDGEFIERKSDAWEDEYTLRLSGFSEAKSRIALELEDKRKRLLDVREQMEQRLKNIGNQRREIGRERVRLRDERERLEETQKKLEGQIEAKEREIDKQKKVIADQRKQIDKLTPEEPEEEEQEQEQEQEQED